MKLRAFSFQSTVFFVLLSSMVFFLTTINMMDSVESAKIRVLSKFISDEISMIELFKTQGFSKLVDKDNDGDYLDDAVENNLLPEPPKLMFSSPDEVVFSITLDRPLEEKYPYTLHIYSSNKEDNKIIVKSIKKSNAPEETVINE